MAGEYACMGIYMYVCSMYVCMYALPLPMRARHSADGLLTCQYACMGICIYACIHHSLPPLRHAVHSADGLLVSVYEYTHVRMCYMYVCVHVPVWVHVTVLLACGFAYVCPCMYT